MINMTRRHFLYGVSLLSIAGGVLANPVTNDAKSSIDKSVMRELLQVLALWRVQESLPPEEFLATRGVNINNKSAIASLSQQDFIEGNLFEVKGLVLAKTEAAAISVFAEKLMLKLT